MHAYLGGTLNQFSSSVIRVGGVADHVHILFVLKRVESLSSHVEEIKTASSVWVKTKGGDLRGFAWQAGYAAFSVSHSQVPRVVDYIDRQEEHRRRQTFKAGLLGFLKRHEMEYDERYLWD